MVAGIIAVMLMMFMFSISPMITSYSLVLPLWKNSIPAIMSPHPHYQSSYLKIAASSLFVTTTAGSDDGTSSSRLPPQDAAASTESVASRGRVFEKNYEENSDKNNYHDFYPCRSNSTHIVWYTTNLKDEMSDDPVRFTCTWQTIRNAKIAAYEYLRQNVMSFDIPFLETMGFHDSNDDNDNSNNNDGLTNGMIGPVIDLALTTKINFLYTDIVPQSIFYEYVLNYANVNENRNNIRPYIFEYLIQPLFFPKPTTSSTSSQLFQSPASNYTMADAIRIINANMWHMLAPSKHTDCIRFVSGQTPIIFDPMSVLTFGYGSCTGISILLVQALRTAGIPARLAGTPAWNQNVQHGNHNWVEVWLPTTVQPHTSAITGVQLNPTMYASLQKANALNDHNDNNRNDDENGGVWLFIEGSPNMTTVDSIEDWWNPCEHFLCDADRQINQTQYFAAKLEHNTSTYFPLAWDVQNPAVPAVNRTLFYHTICAQCK